MGAKYKGFNYQDFIFKFYNLITVFMALDFLYCKGEF